MRMQNDPCQEIIQICLHVAPCVMFVTSKSAETLAICDF